LARLPPASSTALILLFREEVFSGAFVAQPCRPCPWNVHRQDACATSHTNEVDRTNILAPGLWPESFRAHLLPAFTTRRQPNDWLLGSCIQLQQRNCSRFTRDFLRRSTSYLAIEFRCSH